jgi:hypothetical protein
LLGHVGVTASALLIRVGDLIITFANHGDGLFAVCLIADALPRAVHV